MSYPLVFSYHKDEFARVNYDGSWSVDWKKTLYVACENQVDSPNNKAIVACAIALMAAKDNFYLTPWETSDKWKDKWDGKNLTIDIDPEVNEVHLQMKFNSDVIIQVNADGSWSIHWDLVKQAFAENSNKKTSSICQMLLAARYNFQTKPWTDDEADEDEDEY